MCIRDRLVLVDGLSELGLEDTHGLSVSIRRHRVAGRDDAPYVDLSCLDSGALQTFATVAADIATAVVRCLLYTSRCV